MAVDPTKLPPPNEVLGERAMAALNRLGKWRSVFAGWQLGTRADTDAECRAVRDHRELSMLMRAELSALVALLISKGVITPDEWADQMREEAEALSASFEQKFPGFQATDTGMVIDPMQAAETMKGWRP